MFVLAAFLSVLGVSAYDGKTLLENKKVSLKGTKALIGKAAKLAETKSKSHHKFGEASKDVVKKFSTTAAVYGTINSGWGTQHYFSGTTCSTAEYVVSRALGVCTPYSSTSWSTTSVTLTGTIYTVYTNVFSDAACTVYVSTYTSTAGSSACTAEGTTNSYYVSTSSSAPSTGNHNIVTQEFTTSGCTGSAVSQEIDYPYCQNADPNDDLTGSWITTCSGSSYTVTEYSGTGCTGTTATVSFTIPSTCTAEDDTTPLYYSDSYCSSSSSSSCFAGSETVTMESGETKLISEVSVGDRVLAYSTKTNSAVYSDVISVPHAENTVRAPFTQISTAEKAIKLTEDHLLQAGSCSAGTFELTRAGDVKVGDCINTVSGAQSVVSVANVKEEGIYTVVTNEEYVIVSDVVASPFAVNHFIVNKFYNIHRALYNFAPYSMKSAFLAISNGIARQVAQFSTSA